MDEKDFRELQQLKEKKDAEQLEMQSFADLGDLILPETDDAVPEEEVEEEISPKDKTVTFASVAKKEPTEEELQQQRERRREAVKKRKRIFRITAISAGSVIAAAVVLFTVYFAVRNANRKHFDYNYWGSGLFLSEEEGVKHYSFFGHITDLTVYDKIGQVCAVAEFDKDGNCVRETQYDPEGNVTSYYVHDYENRTRVKTAYYEQGQLVTVTLYQPESDRSVRTERTYLLENNRKEVSLLTLNEKGNVETETIYSDDLPSQRLRYRDALVVERTFLNENGEEESKTVYEYNQQRELLTETLYGGDASILSRTVYQYNEDDLLSKTITYDGNGTIIDFCTYSYDAAQNPIKQVFYTADGQIKSQLIRTFNNKGKVTKETWMAPDGSVSNCVGYEYTEQGFISRLIHYNPQYSTQIDSYIVYVRDAAGNMTETNEYNAANVLIEKQVFNAAGYVTEQTSYSDAGVLIYQQKNQYDDKQALTQSEVYRFTETGSPEDYLSVRYDSGQRIVMTVEENFLEKTYDQQTYTYGEDGAIASIAHYDRNGVILSQIAYHGDQIHSTATYENGKEAERIEFRYDAAGNVIEKTVMDYRTNQVSKIAYSYSAQNVLLFTITSDATGTPVSQEEYDKSGNVTQRTFYAKNGMTDHIVGYTYDEENRVITELLFNEHGELQTRTVYDYSSNGDADYQIYDAEDRLIFDSLDPDRDYSWQDEPEEPDEPTLPEEPDETEEPEEDTDAPSTPPVDGNESEETASGTGIE